MLHFPIYLDNHATTPMDPRVFEAMKLYFMEDFGNPASTTHVFGWKAEEAVKKARLQVAQLIHAKDSEIIWTSGTTESINMALIGVARTYKEKGNHIISCVTEHKAALETLKYLEEQGFKVSYLPVDEYGLVDPEAVRKAISKKTILISTMAANNEIGTIHPIAEIGKIVKERVGAIRESPLLFHVDAAQACGKIPIDVQAMGIDLLSMSAHKVYGPKGVGALYIRSRSPRVRLEALLHGGTQQELRPGTLPVPNIVGMGKAFEIAGREMGEEAKRLVQLREKLYRGIMEGVGANLVFAPGQTQGLPLQNGHPTQRLPGNLNLSFPGIKSEDLLMRLRDVALSSGSACSSGSLEPSYVIQALGESPLGAGDERAKSSIRFGIGRFNTEEEIDFVIQAVVRALK